MSEVKISAEPRTEFGKGGARRTRRAGKVPAVLYGHGEKPQAHRAAGPRVRRRDPPRRHQPGLQRSTSADGTQALALPKAIQRDPIKDTFEHVDLLIVRRGEKVTVDVPVQLVGEAARDTLVMHEHDTLSVIADAHHLPDHLEASIEGLEAGSPGHRRRRRAAGGRRAGRRPGADRRRRSPPRRPPSSSRRRCPRSRRPPRRPRPRSARPPRLPRRRAAEARDAEARPRPDRFARATGVPDARGRLSAYRARCGWRRRDGT